MSTYDILSVLQWWAVIFLIGITTIPLTLILFNRLFDKGYFFSRIIGAAVISYIVFLLGILHVVPFTRIETLIILFAVGIITWLIFWKRKKQIGSVFVAHWRLFFFEEVLFLATLFFWSYIRSFSPDIHGLEKFMDFGFMNTILRSTYFPPKDMWYTPYPINYYYFGHFITAVLTRLSNIPSTITYNLMLATLFACTFTGSFSVGANMLQAWKGKLVKITDKFSVLFSGLLTAFLVTFAGNLHTIYTFFKAYQNDHPVPIWQLAFQPGNFPNAYWYPNATRFIYHTIHEFPIYSFVVSDLHGHVLDIPFVLLIIMLLLSLVFLSDNYVIPANKTKKDIYGYSFGQLSNYQLILSVFFGFILAVMYMTNAWDGLIYFLLAAGAIGYRLYIEQRKYFSIKKIFINTFIPHVAFIFGFFLVFALPYSLYFKPFASGIGVLCAPTFLTNIGKIGPLLFEANHCQHSPLWQLITLYGFFYFWVISFLVMLYLLRKHKQAILKSDIFILVLITLATILIIIPEFIYLKDIYPEHYRANTMFKLVYQSFIMLSIVSAYVIMRLKSTIPFMTLSLVKKGSVLIYTLVGLTLFSLVAIYPYFAITSYYGSLTSYHGLEGTIYLKGLYPTDYDAIQWINTHLHGQDVILEAQGDSYTDYARVSTNTGLPTVLGWTVHEWLWRGTYDIVAPRITDVQTLYETTNLTTAKLLIDKYNISYIFVGDLERQKYKNFTESTFMQLGKVIYQNGNTKIYKINK